MANIWGVKHKYVFDLQPEEAWYSGWAKQFLRVRSISAIVGLQGLAAAWSFAIGNPIVAAGLAGVSITSLSFLVLIRTVALRNCRCERSLHELTHDLRDRFRAIQEVRERELRRTLIGGMHSATVERVADIFRSRMGCQKINCCLRMQKWESNGTISYVTVARSVRMDVGRLQATEPLASEAGLVKALMDKKCRGCFYIPDVEKAVEDDIWKKDGK